METINWFEVTMLACFGASWPFQVMKTIRTKKSGGKSPIFLALICIGYLSGIIFKLTGNTDRVIFLYALNGSMVLTELLLYVKYEILGRTEMKPSNPGPSPAACSRNRQPC